MSSVLSPLLLYLDRFMLGAAAGLTEVGYYAAPMELVSRLVILPASFVTVLFPAVSAIAAMGNRPALVRLLGSSECGLALALLPLTCALIAFAPAGLDWWLGPEFARQSATVLRILALGLFVNALAYVPFSFVQALGRPELTARFHLLEFAFHFPLTWVLVTRYGAVGAAAAWTTRVVVDAALVTGAATTLVRLPPGRLVGRRTALVIVAGVGLLAALTAASALRPVLAALGSLAAGGAFAAFAWYGVLEPHERASARALLGTGRLVSAAGGPRC